MQELKVAKLAAGTVYKLIGAGTLCGFVPIFIIAGILTYFGWFSFTWNRQPVTGIAALWAVPLTGIFFSALFTMVIGSVVAFGLWLYAKFRPFTLRYFEITSAS